MYKVLRQRLSRAWFHRGRTLLLGMFLSFQVLCAGLALAGGSGLKVYTVNYPLKYFAERIAANHAMVVFPAPSGVEPALWKPDLTTIAEYQHADLILLNGANYANWAAKVSLPLAKLVNTSAHLRDRYINLNDLVTHTHGPAGEHSHTGTAFTTWLDFQFAAEQAAAIKNALVRKLPEQRKELEKHYLVLREELLDLDQTVEKIVASKRGQPLLASHPVYQYLANRYGLNLQSVHWEPDAMPDPDMWTEMERLLARHPAKWMIWEGTPMKEPVKKLASLGVRSIVFDPTGNTPERGDFMSVMRQNADNLRSAFK